LLISGTYKQLFTQLLVEGVREQVRETRQNLNTIQCQVCEVAEQQQQRTHGGVHDRHLDLKTRDKLDQNKHSEEIPSNMSYKCTKLARTQLTLLSLQHKKGKGGSPIVQLRKRTYHCGGEGNAIRPRFH